MKVTKFEELIAWQKAQELAVDVYHYFGTSKDFGSEIKLQEQLFQYQIILPKDLKGIVTKNLSGFLKLREVHAAK